MIQSEVVIETTKSAQGIIEALNQFGAVPEPYSVRVVFCQNYKTEGRA